MRKLHEVLRLKWEHGLSHRAIAHSCGISPATVSEYVQRAHAAGLSWPLPADLTEDQLQTRLFPSATSTHGRSIPTPDWAQIHAELRRKGVTLRLLWDEYREAHPDGYRYSQFCEHYRQWASHLQPTMRMCHAAGERLFVDYAGQTIPLVHPETGEVQAAQIFVAVLGASSYTYVEAHLHQDLPSWIGAGKTNCSGSARRKKITSSSNGRPRPPLCHQSYARSLGRCINAYLNSGRT